MVFDPYLGKTDLRGARKMPIADATRILASNVAERVLVRIARHEEMSLPLIIEDEVQRVMTRIAEKQGWEEWPSDQIRN